MDKASELDTSVEICRLVSGSNQAWLNGNADFLRDFFHENVIFKGPKFQTLGSGREACVKSYEDFIRAAKIVSFKESDVRVDVIEDTAIVSFAWDIAYEMNGQKFRETGHDLFVLSQANGRWQAVWRAMLPNPAE